MSICSLLGRIKYLGLLLTIHAVSLEQKTHVMMIKAHTIQFTLCSVHHCSIIC